MVNNEIWDTNKLQKTVTLLDTNILSYTAQWSTDGAVIAFRTSDDRRTVIYSAVNGNLLHSFGSSDWQIGAEYGPKWSPNNLYFATLGRLNALRILDALTGQSIAQYPVDADRIDYISWSSDSTHIALVTTKSVEVGSPGSYPEEWAAGKAIRISINIVDISTGKITTVINGIQGGIYSLVWSADSKQLAGNTSFGSILIWDAHTGVLLDSYQSPPYRIISMDYSHYGGRLIIGMNTGFPISVPQNGVFTPLSLSTNTQNELNGIIQFLIPAPSLEKLQSITQSCGVQSKVQQSLTAQITANKLQIFIEKVSDLNDAQIPTSCKADLLAVAHALMTKTQ